MTANNPWWDKPNAIAEMEDEYQQWIGAARDMATPAHALQEIVHALAPPEMWQRVESTMEDFTDLMGLGGQRVLVAIAAHPNAPPALLAELLDGLPDAARGFCRNPAAPFLLLEAPDFVVTLSRRAQLALLCQGNLSPIFARQMANAFPEPENEEPLEAYPDRHADSMREAAHFHVAVAGERSPGSDGWQNAVRDYWQSVCADPGTKYSDAAHQAAELADIGLVPLWAATGMQAPPSPAQPPQTTPRAPEYPYLEAWFRYECAEGSPEEAAMLKQIGPDVKNKAAFARALRAGGNESDLLYVAQTETSERGLILQAMLRHPKLDAHVLEALALRNEGKLLSKLLGHEKNGPGLLVKCMEHHDPALRYLARRHKNAPNDNGETTLRAFVNRAFTQYEEATGRWYSNRHLSPFASFVASLTYPARSTPAHLLNRAKSLRWMERVEAVFIASANPDLLHTDEAGRTCADLLHHLSMDGNRLVRAAARAYITDPKTVFQWDEKGGNNE